MAVWSCGRLCEFAMDGMVRSVVVLGLVFMVHFTAMLGVTHLQSTVNAAKGIGTAALAAQYFALLISSLFLTVAIIQRLGCKWTMGLAVLGCLPYIAAQMYVQFYTLVPAAVLMGLSLAPLWSSKCTYLCVMAEAYSKAKSLNLKMVRDRFIGCFFMIFLFSMVWGNLISSFVMTSEKGVPSNFTADREICGKNFCFGSAAAEANLSSQRPDSNKIMLFTIVYLCCVVFGFLLIAFGLDGLDKYGERERRPGGGAWTQLAAACKLHRNPHQLLLLPFSLWIGVDYAFLEAEYTAAFVGCSGGVAYIGFVIAAYGLANSFMALTTGWLLENVGRRRMMMFFTLEHSLVYIALLFWVPSSGKDPVLFVVAALLGAADGHWAVQINALYGILFPNEEGAAYSNFRLWQSAGFAIAFSYSRYICTAAKIYIILALLIVALAAYFLLEYRMSRPMKIEKSSNEQ